MQKTDDVMEIDLKEMISALWTKAWLIAICGVALAIGGFVVSKFFMTPIYCSTAKVYVMTQSTKQGAVYQDVVMSTYLSQDYAYLVKSRDVLEKVIKDCELKDTYNSLAGRITVENLADTRILSIAVQDTDPMMAQVIANEVCATAAVHLKSVMNLEAVNIAEKANFPIIQSSPSVKKWTAMGLLAGMFMCSGVIVLRVLLDDTIKTREDVERYLGLSTLALIPMAEEETEKSEQTEADSTREEPQAEAGTESVQADVTKTEPEPSEAKKDAAETKEETAKEVVKGKRKKAAKKEEA